MNNNNNNGNNYVTRMDEEYWDIMDKIRKAENWLDCSSNGNEKERILLKNQLFHMRSYRDILVERILYANKKED